MRSRPLPNGLGRNHSSAPTANRGSRRAFLQAGAGFAAGWLTFPTIVRGLSPRVIIIGAGFGGASCARALKVIDPALEVTLIDF